MTIDILLVNKSFLIPVSISTTSRVVYINRQNLKLMVITGYLQLVPINQIYSYVTLFSLTDVVTITGQSKHSGIILNGEMTKSLKEKKTNKHCS